MIKRCWMMKCDICGREELSYGKANDVPYKDRWKDFVLGDLYQMQMEKRDPSNLCPQCSERIGKFIYAMQNEYKKGSPV